MPQIKNQSITDNVMPRAAPAETPVKPAAKALTKAKSAKAKPAKAKGDAKS
jgi:hypothetical protein